MLAAHDVFYGVKRGLAQNRRKRALKLWNAGGRGDDFMESILIVSGTEKSIAFILEFLNSAPPFEIVTVQSCHAARGLLKERCFDLCIVNTPLPDEFGDEFASDMSSGECSQVMIMVKKDCFDEVSARVEAEGVLTLSKPMNRQTFMNALKLAGLACRKMKKLKQENGILQQKIEDLRYINRAKCILIQYLSINEKEAHRYIEKQAMDLRITKKQIAEAILKTYEN